jgi:hypothetical protein
LACPFFLPTERADNIALPHPARLPLGAAWRGLCGAPGAELVQLDERELEPCNLGYAQACPRFPKDSPADAVRFAVSKHSPERLLVQFSMESKHAPAGHGQFEYDRHAAGWATTHSDSTIQRLADCFLRAYLERANL